MTTNKPGIETYEPSEKGVTAMRKASFRNTGLNRYVRLSDYEALQVLCDRLQLEAQCHAQEARSANATIAEIYRLVSGGTGEPGNWSGAEPVRRKLEELQAECEGLRKEAERYRWLRDRALQVPFSAPAIIMVNSSCDPVSGHAWRSSLGGNDADAAIDAAMQGDQP